MQADEPGGTSGRLQTLVGIATVVIVTAVHAGLALLGLVTNRASYPSLWPQLTAYGALTALLACSAAFLLRGWPLPKVLVLAGVPLALGAGVLSTAPLSSAQFLSSAHWSFLVVGWFGVLLLHHRLRPLAVFLVANVAIVLGLLVLAGLPGRQAAAGMATVVLGVSGQQLAYAVLMTLLRDCARRAEHSAQERARIDTELAIADEVHADRQRRYADLTTTVVPLLTVLAEDELDPRDEGVRRQCALEAARMRRLFAESDSVEDRVVHELQAGIDVAERRGVVVSLAVRGTPVPLPVELRRALTDPGLAAVAAGRQATRVTVVHTTGEVRLSVVTDEAAAPIPRSEHPGVRTDTLARDGKLWVTVRVAVPARDQRSSSETSPS